MLKKKQILTWFKNGNWNKDMLYQAVIKGILTEDEYNKVVEDRSKK